MFEPEPRNFALKTPAAPDMLYMPGRECASCVEAERRQAAKNKK